MERIKLEMPEAPPAIGQVVPKIAPPAKHIVNPPTEPLPGHLASDADRIGDLLNEFIFELHGKKRFQDALAVAGLYREFRPSDPTGLYNEALTLFHLDHYEEARNVLMQVPDAVWELPQYHHNMACIQVAMGNVTEGLKHANAAARQNKNALRAMLKDQDLRPIWAALKRDTRGIQ
jgi:hypothetical protein